MSGSSFESLMRFNGKHVVEGIQTKDTMLTLRLEGVDTPFVHDFSGMGQAIIQETFDEIALGATIYIHATPHTLYIGPKPQRV